VFLVASSLSLTRIYTLWVLENGQLTTKGSARRIEVIPLPLINVDELLTHDALKLRLEQLKQFDTKHATSGYATAINAIRLTYGHPRTLSFVLAQIEQANGKPLSTCPTLVRLCSEFALVIVKFTIYALTHPC